MNVRVGGERREVILPKFGFSISCMPAEGVHCAFSSLMFLYPLCMCSLLIVHRIFLFIFWFRGISGLGREVRGLGCERSEQD